MTQLTVSIDDISPSSLRDVKRAIRMLRGVRSVREQRARKANPVTLKAMKAAEAGDTIVCEDMQAYLKLVGYEVQD